MTVLIEGLAFPFNRKNENGEGVPLSEADNAINSLKNAVVRICSRNDPHGCDYNADPRSEIGKIVDAWHDGNNAYAKAEIIDSVAAQKMKDGVWKPGWSIFAGYNNISDGWVSGIDIESISIVDHPAWNSANWKVVSASGNEKKFRSFSLCKVITASEKTGSGKMSDEIEKELKELEKKLEEANAVIAELKPKADEGGKVADLETQIAELTASKNKLEEQLTEKDKLIASIEREKANAVPTEAVKALIASAIAEHDKEMLAIQERGDAFKNFAAARNRLGIETNPEDFKSLSTEELNKLATDLNGLKLGASGSGISYPAGPSKPQSTVGRYDSTKKEWVI